VNSWQKAITISFVSPAMKRGISLKETWDFPIVLARRNIIETRRIPNIANSAGEAMPKKFCCMKSMTIWLPQNMVGMKNLKELDNGTIIARETGL